MKTLAVALALAASFAQAAPTNYQDNGASWTGTCATGKEQSPIDLPTTLEAKEEESFFKHYENVYKPWNKAVSPDWNSFGKVFWSLKSAALYLTLDHKGLGENPTVEPTAPAFFATPNYFTSTAGQANGAVEKYFARQLHFHTKSEHTIDGKQFEFEMHIVHSATDTVPDKAPDGVTAGSAYYPYGYVAVMGVMFDPVNYDKSVSTTAVDAIDKFFDTMGFDKMADQPACTVTGTDESNCKVSIAPDEIALGELMSVINTNDRWVYKGSLTTPGCNEGLYWNFVKTVYPIKPHHLAYYKAALAKHAKTKDADTDVIAKGNFRVARVAGPEHNLKLYKGKAAPAPAATEDDVDSAANASLAMIILLCIAMFVALSLTVYACVLHDKLNTPTYKMDGDKVDVGVVPEEQAQPDQEGK